MISLVSASHYFQPVCEGSSLPALEPALMSVCRENFRRIDRFIQLALLGSARCAVGHALRSDCGIYLGSGLGPMSNNITVQEQLVRDWEIPKPYNFINTLGSAAGFYVARNLGLSGQNFFISRRGASLEAALSVAMSDMALGITQQALVGVVEEATLPLAAHRLRQGLPEDQPLAEGSHWLLLQSDMDGTRPIGIRRFVEFSGLEEFLQSNWNTGDRLCCAHGMESRMAGILQSRFLDSTPTDPDAAFHDNPEAVWVAEFAASNKSGKLFLVNGNSERGWSLLHLGA
ncbi:MAG: beta-ketoacyl synthase N-terminal-like domain-containing protein [Gammaproteobacteria bacterium]